MKIVKCIIDVGSCAEILPRPEANPDRVGGGGGGG